MDTIEGKEGVHSDAKLARSLAFDFAFFLVTNFTLGRFTYVCKPSSALA
jgi:hypothetical protein